MKKLICSPTFWTDNASSIVVNLSLTKKIEMRSKILVFAALVTLFGGITSCMKSVDSQDEAKVIENDTAIANYNARNGLNAVKQESGYYFVKTKTNPLGDSAKIGNEVRVVVKAKLLDKAETVVLSDTTAFPMGAFITGVPGVELATYKMQTGEKAIALLPFYLAFGSAAKTNIPAYSPVRVEIEFLKSRTEVQQIDDYLGIKKFIVTERTAQNLVIIRTDTSTAAGVGPGKSVTVKYTGKFLNDNKFDEGSFTYNTGTGSLITGFDQAVQKLPLKGKAIVVFPSALGYKAEGSTKIPPYAPLVFELELL
jgi:FKBP-type peptidyl-prolyl cis-trans isomerase